MLPARSRAARPILCREFVEEAAVGVIAVLPGARAGPGPGVVFGVSALLELDHVAVRNLLVSEDVPPCFTDAACEIGSLGVVFHRSSPLAHRGPVLIGSPSSHWNR